MNENLHELPIYFIRHKFNGIDEAAIILMNQKLIGFHFADEFFERKEDYKQLHTGYEKGFSKAFDAFSRLGQSGGIVVFEYNDPDEFYVATVNGNQKISRFDFEYSDQTVFIYKVLQYVKARKFSYAEYPVLLAIRPPYGTACQPGWHYRQIIRHIYLGSNLPRTVNLLHPKVLEQLCENYLRSEFVPPPIRIQYTIMKTGKTLPIVDIVGRSLTGQKLLVQVTHHSGGPAKAKAEQLIKIRRHIPSAKSILFSADSHLAIDGLDIHVNISSVFSTFNNSPEDWHQAMIKEMIGIKLNEDNQLSG